MFWKIFAVLFLISASYFGCSHLKLAKTPSVIESQYWTEKSSSGIWYRICGKDNTGVICKEWAKPNIKK